MTCYEKLLEMDGDTVYSLAKDMYFTVTIQHGHVYLGCKRYLPTRVFEETVDSLHLCPVYLGPMIKSEVREE